VWICYKSRKNLVVNFTPTVNTDVTKPRWRLFWFSLVGKLSENCRKIVGKFRWVPMPSKYSIFIVGTHRINLISMSKKCYVTLILEYCVIRSGWRSFPSTLFTIVFQKSHAKRCLYLRICLPLRLYTNSWPHEKLQFNLPYKFLGSEEWWSSWWRLAAYKSRDWGPGSVGYE
jgi:hypothetical protein